MSSILPARPLSPAVPATGYFARSGMCSKYPRHLLWLTVGNEPPAPYLGERSSASARPIRLRHLLVLFIKILWQLLLCSVAHARACIRVDWQRKEMRSACMASMYTNIFCATNCSPGLGPEAIQLCDDKDLALLYGCTWHGAKQVTVRKPLGTKDFVFWEMTQVVRVFGTEKVNLSTLPLGPAVDVQRVVSICSQPFCCSPWIELSR